MCACVWGVGCGDIEIRKYHNVELFLSYHLAVVYIFGRYISDHNTCTCM